VRLALIRDEQSRRDEAKHMARLRAISEKIDKVQAALPQSLDPQLGNYLRRRSYERRSSSWNNYKGACVKRRNQDNRCIAQAFLRTSNENEMSYRRHRMVTPH